ncbi:MAG TPA: ABC transporter permease [Acidimicrobiales bacterium]|jgi:peptide/nickel transport system permease protein|nr:ABC transporter permease [Acidimicrobiales bacterium]
MSFQYLIRRLLQVVPAVAAIIVITFVIIQLAPGDPVDAVASGNGDDAYYAFMREKFGLDQPRWVQFRTFATNVLTGDLGVSFAQGQRVSTLIWDRLPPTLLLMGSALVISSIGGLAFGLLAAKRPYRFLDMGISTAALLGYALPVFWLAQLALLWLAFRTGWFPIQGMTDARANYTGWAHYRDVIHHLALPALVLAVSEVALVARVARTGLIQQNAADYVRTAKSKGLSPNRSLLRHALPNAMLPVVTVIGGRIGSFFSGAVLVETVFGWPGMGRLLLQASENRDHPVLLGLVLVVAFSVVLANLLTDLVYAWIDPRIRFR